MEAIKCSRGHYYDRALGACPVCAADGAGAGFGFGAPMNSDFVPDDIPATAPATSAAGNSPAGGFGGFGGFGGNPGETVPASEGYVPTMADPQPRNPVVNSGSNGGNGGGNWQIEDYEPTMPEAFDGVEGFDPIVGWLICVKGPNRGKDYRLHSGTNFIGRSKQMDVCIEGDATISSKNAASISYDDRSKSFFIQKGEVRNLIYLNGRPVRSDADLVIYDKIEIGSTALLFIPLCGEQFNWQDN